MESRRVLIVDDEPQIREVVQTYLEREGFEVIPCGTVAEAFAAIAARRPEMMILDITLPDGNGLDILRQTVESGNRIPTIMLTARSGETDRVIGLEFGADDYVTKPFSPREVTARVRALFRRVDERSQSATAHRIAVGDVTMDLDAHEVLVRGRVAKVTATEFRLLRILAERPGEVFTRAQLLDRLKDGGDVFERTLDRHINNLRKKIEEHPARPTHVVTVYGIGYKMRRPD